MIVTDLDGADEAKYDNSGAHTVNPFQTSSRDKKANNSMVSPLKGDGIETVGGGGAKMRPQFLKSVSSLEREERENAAYHDHGRHHFASERMAAIEEDDPFLYVFTFVDTLQEKAVPLILGVIIALVLANVAPETYKYYFASVRCEQSDDDHTTDAHRRRRHLSSSGCDDGGDDHVCHEDRFLLSDCLVFGHPLTLHFFANDIVMSFFFGLAMKEVVEAVLPGGSLNPPSKAMNPILTTIGGVLGPIIVYVATLKLFITCGVFDSELDRGLHYDDLMQGWGVVTATDIVLAWLVGRLVFGDGHPAIDFLLLLAVADDAIGMAIIAIFYPDPDHPVRPAYLPIVFGAMGMAYALRKWHFRKERVSHQPWQPYIFFSGLISWIGLVEAHLHPALALVFIVPFMPGPDLTNLNHLEEEVEEDMEEDSTEGKAHNMLEERRLAMTRGEVHEGVDESDILAYHHAHRGRGMSIQAGLFSGLAGHRVDDAFKVIEYDEDGEEHLHVSTLDSFEHFWKIYVDFGLGLFALCNAGVKFEGVGGMTYLVVISLVVGKYLGILLMYKLSKWLGFLPPLGVRTRHIRMIGLLASMGLTVALFVSDVAFTDVKLQGEAKLGALLSGLVGFIAYGISHFFDFSHERVDDQAKLQLKEEVEEANQKSAPRFVRARGLSLAATIPPPMVSISDLVDGHGPKLEAGL